MLHKITHLTLCGLGLILWTCTSDGQAAPAAMSKVAPQLVTQSSAKIVQLQEGIRLDLSANTELVKLPTIPAPAKGQNLAPRALQFELIRGRVDVTIDASRTPIYTVLVRAPKRVTAYLKGGTASIISSEAGVGLVARTGVEISSGVADRWRPVQIGTALVVTKDHPGGEMRSLLPAPNLQTSSPLALSLGNTDPATLGWSPIPDAKSYRVSLLEIADEGPGSKKVFDVASPGLILPPLASGQYRATVVAFDSFGLESPESNSVSLRVVGIKLPDGAYLKSGIPQLGPGQAVELTHTDGLEMAYGSGLAYGPAPESLRLVSNRPTLVRLREQASNRETVLKLEPRNVSGTISFSPPRAEWPGKPVGVTVDLRGEQGTPLPDSINVGLVASINTEVIDVDWKQTGHVWHAEIKQPAMAGPWVLRVAAVDQTGQLLARDFIEIAVPKKAAASPQRDYYSSR